MKIKIFTLIVFMFSQANAGGLIGIASVIDGDTIEIDGERIRLHGIDAPESKQQCINAQKSAYGCGQLATQRLKGLVNGQITNCNVLDKDRYGRHVAVCFTNSLNINEQLVAEGLALAYKKYSSDYSSAESRARKDRIGLWQGDFIEPWDWRRGERLIGQNYLQNNDCFIKGNISSSGKIYHTPSSKWYEKTKIDKKKGERWFCTEAEALAAGWRAANQ